jgi:ribosomal-protein-alanine N-acetyltransferase
MEICPVLQTQRLILRPFTLEDAPIVQRLAGAYEVAATTLNMPHPYQDGMAQQWISSQRAKHEKGEVVDFAIVIREGRLLCGAIGLGIDKRNNNAELGYWIGVPYWGQGYCTEAAKEVLSYGFKSLNLHRIYAAHLKCNPASGRVMQKIGMSYEGCSRDHFCKWGQFYDDLRYGILASELDIKG